MTERLDWIKETLICAVEGQLGDIADVDAKELGEVIDMIKDIEEAKYYCTVTKAMEEGKEYQHEGDQMYYTTSGMIKRGPSSGHHQPVEMREMSWDYDGEGSYKPRHGEHNTWNSTHTDMNEGRSYRSRKNYMESKEMHKDKTTQMRELEKYAQELTQDIVEMIEGASPEEKQYLSKKITTLANKIIQE